MRIRQVRYLAYITALHASFCACTMPFGRKGKCNYDPKITLTSVINAGKWSASRLGRFIFGEQAPRTMCRKKGWAPEPRLTPWGTENYLPLQEI
jgi:hypothetical protein